MNMAISRSQIAHYRTIWISDIHLGTRGCQAERLLDFLKHTDSETLYLVGDIVDGWRLKKSWFWAQSHNDVIQKVLRKARKGTRVVYIPGNHDEALRGYMPIHLGGVEVHGEVIHEMADGRRFLVLHGDQFDAVVRYAKWLAFLGDWAYNAALTVNVWFNAVRRKLGLPYLVAVGLSEAKGQERGRICRTLRKRGRRRGEATQGRRRDLRPHPQGRDPRLRRHHLLQRRRLGRKLHGARRACRRPARDHRLDRPPPVRPAERRARGSRNDWSAPNDAAGADVALPERNDEAKTLKIVVVTDAWYPQVNGVVRTLDTVRGELVALGHHVAVISPDRFRTIPCPTYPEIRLALFPAARVRRLVDDFGPDAIHIATEGPLGWAARRLCRKRGLPFTTSFHTKFPEYVHARFRIPVSWGYAVMRRFHRASSGVMVATPSLMRTLEARGFRNIARWTRGVDTELFRPRDQAFLQATRPISMFVGRVAVEKNIEAFLKLDVGGTKYVVGGGPQIDELKARYPDVVFTGYKTGEELASYIAAADVFVFPSLTDTFGLVLLEAMASGVPVAAFPVTGPVDVVTDEKAGCLDDDLAKATRCALTKQRTDCRAFAERFSWRDCAKVFFDNLRPFRNPSPHP